MKATVHKLIGTAVLGAALLLNSIPAWAGNVSLHEVYINPDNSGANGTLAGARYSADSTQYIGCDHYGSQMYCFARDKSGRTLLCSSTDPRFVDAVKGMTDSSYLHFTTTSYGSACTTLAVNNSSITLR